MSKYPVISLEDAQRYIKARAHEDESVSIDEIRQWSGTGDDISLQPVDELRGKLLSLKKNRFPLKLRKKDPEGGRFESEACVIVHTCLSAIDRHILADHNFWTWLALDKLSDIVEWRFGTEGKVAQPANYGVGTRTENMFFRLWLRAELGKIDGRSPYELAKSGDQDLWRSHLLRQGYANARNIVHSLLKLQAGKMISDRKPVKRLAGGDEPNGIRLLAKRLRRMRANVFFEFLSPQQADALVLELSADLKKGK